MLQQDDDVDPDFLPTNYFYTPTQIEIDQAALVYQDENAEDIFDNNQNHDDLQRRFRIGSKILAKKDLTDR